MVAWSEINETNKVHNNNHGEEKRDAFDAISKQINMMRTDLMCFSLIKTMTIGNAYFTGICYDMIDILAVV